MKKWKVHRQQSCFSYTILLLLPVFHLYDNEHCRVKICKSNYIFENLEGKKIGSWLPLQMCQAKKPCSYPQKCPSHICSHNTVYSRCHCFSPLYPHRLFLQTNIIFDPVAEIHLLFQITSVAVPGCKSVVPSGELPPMLWSEWVNQSISARLRPAAAVSPLSHATTPQCQ